MGVKDQGLQEYLKDNERFADFVNGTIFGGEQIIEAHYLKEVQRKKRVSYKKQFVAGNIRKEKKSVKGDVGENLYHEKVPKESNMKLMYLERERDFLRLHDKPDCKVLLACEAETKANYEMPVRCFTYDSIEYTDQLRTRKSGTGKKRKGRDLIRSHRIHRPLIPVFHQVLYLGQTRWKSKQKLQEMMDIPEKVRSFTKKLPDYDICMTDIHEQNPELFHTEWRDIFRFMKHSRNKEYLKKYMEDNKEEVRKLSEETRWFLAILLDQYTIVSDEIVEVRDLCEAWDGAMQMYADEARKKTSEEMKKQELENKRKAVCKLFSKGYKLTDLAEALDIPLTMVQKWCSI